MLVIQSSALIKHRQYTSNYCAPCTPAFLVLFILLGFANLTRSQSGSICGSIANPTTLRATKLAQNFLTPDFAKGLYRPNLDCNWVIRASSVANRVQLNIHFSQFEGPIFGACDDYMLVRNGPNNINNSQSTSDVQWCDFTNPMSIISTADTLYIQMKTDGYFGRKGVNMSFAEFAMPGCPIGWLAKPELGACYKLVVPDPPLSKNTWLEAQKHCNHDKSNLATITSQAEFNSLLDMFGKSGEKPWIGMFDALEEGTLGNLVSSDPIWPAKPQITNNADNRDCIFLDLTTMFAEDMYIADSCIAERAFICKRFADIATPIYTAPETIIQQSLDLQAKRTNVGAAYLWVWLLISAALLLIIIIITPSCYRRMKRRNSTAPANSADAEARDLIEQRASPDAVQPMLTNHVGHVATTTDRGAERAQNGRAVGTQALPEQNRGYVANGGHTHSARTLLPIEKFDRPHIHMLDNVSAISLDEFWNKIGKEQTDPMRVQTPPQSAQSDSKETNA